MAVTNIPNVQNWTVTPQNGQAGYFTLMNTWLGQSALVIASLQTAIVAQNKANSEINALAIQAENNAIVANGLANFKGVWSGLVSYDKGESVETTAGSKIYYISKVDSNLNHAVTDTNYWLYNPINDKLNKDFSLLTDKTTPIDTDILSIQEIGGLLKKISWANLKATLKTYFDTLYMALTGNQTVAGNKNFTGNLLMTGSSSVIGYGVGSGGIVTQPTSKDTAVTLNKSTGQIITSNSALAANTEVFFILNNSLLTGNETLNVVIAGTGASGIYRVSTRFIINGSAGIILKNDDNTSRSDALTLIFTITKGATA